MAEERVSAYLVEIEPRGGTSEVGSIAARARRSADDVRFLRSIYVPEDDRWFLLYEGLRHRRRGCRRARAGGRRSIAEP
jgi:hypothetical protein